MPRWWWVTDSQKLLALMLFGFLVRKELKPVLEGSWNIQSKRFPERAVLDEVGLSAFSCSSAPFKRERCNKHAGRRDSQGMAHTQVIWYLPSWSIQKFWKSSLACPGVGAQREVAESHPASPVPGCWGAQVGCTCTSTHVLHLTVCASGDTDTLPFPVQWSQG